jgi:hypothetical protein
MNIQIRDFVLGAATAASLTGCTPAQIATGTQAVGELCRSGVEFDNPVWPHLDHLIWPHPDTGFRVVLCS